ncbi:hypothetical protein HK096_004277 [Nowakowskiella sp. JEL0078]|nr:hypothetical protein HK096_004277 [Nowakowskiella sp. JEL0078]
MSIPQLETNSLGESTTAIFENISNQYSTLSFDNELTDVDYANERKTIQDLRRRLSDNSILMSFSSQSTMSLLNETEFSESQIREHALALANSMLVASVGPSSSSNFGSDFETENEDSEEDHFATPENRESTNELNPSVSTICESQIHNRISRNESTKEMIQQPTRADHPHARNKTIDCTPTGANAQRQLSAAAFETNPQKTCSMVDLSVSEKESSDFELDRLLAYAAQYIASSDAGETDAAATQTPKHGREKSLEKPSGGNQNSQQNRRLLQAISFEELIARLPSTSSLFEEGH